MKIWLQKINPRNAVIETDRAFIHVDLHRTHFTVEAKDGTPWHVRYGDRHYKDVSRELTYRRQVSERYHHLLELIEIDIS